MLFRNDKRDVPGPGGTGMRVPLLPLRDIIVFPHMVVPLFVGRQKSIRALEEAMNKQKYILLAAQREAKTNPRKTISSTSGRWARWYSCCACRTAP
jgi:ATP-dependent Lon protease